MQLLFTESFPSVTGQTPADFPRSRLPGSQGRGASTQSSGHSSLTSLMTLLEHLQNRPGGPSFWSHWHMTLDDGCPDSLGGTCLQKLKPGNWVTVYMNRGLSEHKSCLWQSQKGQHNHPDKRKLHLYPAVNEYHSDTEL